MAFELREIVSDLDPRRLRANEDVVLRRHPGIAIESAHRNSGEASFRATEGHARPAPSAEDVREALGFGQRERLKQIFAAPEAKALQGHKQDRGTRSARTLATPRAVAIVGPKRGGVALELDVPAEAPSRDHVLAPRSCRITDSPITCGLRSKGFVEGIRLRRQVARAAGILDPKGT